MSEISNDDSATPPANLSKVQLKKLAKKEQKLAKFEAKQQKIKTETTNKPESQKKPVKSKVDAQPFELPKFTSDGRKDGDKSMPEAYNPRYVEALWYDHWEQAGYFKPEFQLPGSLDPSVERENFVMVIPPPNVTGTLHLGHALTNSIEDAIVRWNRMSGRATLWVPGCDHAGIATQVVVEKKLWRERQLTRHDLGREAFIDEVWKWKDEKGHRIYDQLRSLGSSCDWSRARFTMDPPMSQAVSEAFCRLHQDGLIYRSLRLVNWSCTLRSAISDIEVDKVEINGRTPLNVPGYAKPVTFGELVMFAYQLVPIEGDDNPNSNDELVVATTRLETMLGDVGVAVHPEDDRYKHLIGRQLRHPFVEGRLLPVLGDSFVERDFGTGAVKLTPGHDHNDWEVGQRHSLPVISVIGEDGLMTKETGSQFAGMKRFDARQVVRKELDKLGLLRGSTDNPMVVPICSRSKDVIEPLVKPQWYVRCKEMADKAVKVVADGQLRIIPDCHVKVWNAWLGECRDWCISRQLWWGHRIPAYLVALRNLKKEGNDTFVQLDPSSHDSWIVARSLEEAMTIARTTYPNHSPDDIQLTQDDDVLDTWFSSQLFPFSTMGWPDSSSGDLSRYYPGQLLETGHDILFFWVARMVMAGLQLTGQLPFTTVLLHAMVRDAHGKKMSKSLGNAIDPVDVIRGISLADLQKQLELGNLDPRELTRAKEAVGKDFPKGIPECGTDALRFTLCAYTSHDRNINLNVLRVQGYRFFCNKLWNATRYALYHCLGTDFQPPAIDLGPKGLGNAITKLLLSNASSSTTTTSTNASGLSRMDAWILSRLAYAVDVCEQAFTSHRLSQATTACYNFWLYELCDFYLEYTKQFVKSSSTSTDSKRASLVKNVLYLCLVTGLRLLHPFMPFITEELCHRLPFANAQSPTSLCVSRYPTSYEFAHLRDESGVETELRFVVGIIHKLRGLRASYRIVSKPGEDSLLDVQLLASTNLVQAIKLGSYAGDLIHPLTKCRLTKLTSDLSTVDLTGCISANVSAADMCLTATTDSTQTNQDEQEGSGDESGDEDNSPSPQQQSSNESDQSHEPLCQLFVRLAGRIDVKVELDKLANRRRLIQGQLATLQLARSKPEYAVKVPESKRAKDATKLRELEAELRSSDAMSTGLQDLLSSASTPATTPIHPLLRLIACIASVPIDHLSTLAGDTQSDLQTTIEWLLASSNNQLLLGGNNIACRSLVKQWLAFCCHRLLVTSSNFPACLTTVSKALETSSTGFLASTPSESCADYALVFYLLKGSSLNSYGPNLNKWLDRMKLGVRNHPNHQQIVEILPILA